MPTVGVRPAGSGEDVQAACQLARRQNTLEYEGLLITLVKKQQGVSGWVFQTKKIGNSTKTLLLFLTLQNYDFTVLVVSHNANISTLICSYKQTDISNPCSGKWAIRSQGSSAVARRLELGSARNRG